MTLFEQPINSYLHDEKFASLPYILSQDFHGHRESNVAGRLAVETNNGTNWHLLPAAKFNHAVVLPLSEQLSWQDKICDSPRCFCFHTEHRKDNMQFTFF